MGAAGKATQSRTQVRTRLCASHMQSRTQVQTRPRRPGRDCGAYAEPSVQARLSPSQTVESDRMWKAPGHRPLTLRTFPQPLEIPAPVHHPGFPQLRTASAGRTGKRDEDKTSLHLYASIQLAEWLDDHPPAHSPRTSPAAWTAAPPKALTHTPPSLDRTVIVDGNLPTKR